MRRFWNNFLSQKGDIAIFSLLAMAVIVIGTIFTNYAVKESQETRILAEEGQGVYVCKEGTPGIGCKSGPYGVYQDCYTECIPDDQKPSPDTNNHAIGYSRVIGCMEPTNEDPDPWVRGPAQKDCSCDIPRTCVATPTFSPTVTLIPSYTPPAGNPTVTLIPTPSTYNNPTPTLISTVTRVPTVTLAPVACICGDPPCSRNCAWPTMMASDNEELKKQFGEACGTCGGIGLQNCSYNPLIEEAMSARSCSLEGVTPPVVLPSGKPTVTLIPTSIPTGQQTQSTILPLDVWTTQPFNTSTYYSQCDSPWGPQTYNACSKVCNLGCGSTSSSMVISALKNNSVAPDTAWKYFIPPSSDPGLIYCQGSPRHPGTNGIDPEDLIKIFPSYGLNSEIVYYDSPEGLSINDPKTQKAFKEQMANFINAGWKVIANTTQFSADHFVVVSEITQDGLVYVYDPYPFEGAKRGKAVMSKLGDDNGLFEIAFVIVK